jgi:eukaryotic-like serine/threonine-protein kinase
VLRDLTPERWEELSRLIDEASVRTTAERATYLDQACKGDHRLRAYAERLLMEAERAEREASTPAEERFKDLLAAPAPADLPAPLWNDFVIAERYHVVRELGHGSMATVYLVRDSKGGTHVALKLLDPRLGGSIAEERFKREVRVVSSLEHPHILPLFESGRWQDTLFYTMPFVDGVSLRRRIDEEGPLPLDVACRLTREIADALQHAHDRGVVHRDVKPDNVLLRDGHAIVADFGVARAIYSVVDSTIITGAGLAIGTPAYMSPEQLSGGAVDHRSDVYSLGCVLFEMLAGERPLADKGMRHIMLRRLRDSLPDVRSRRADVPVDVAGVVRRALATSPDERFASAREMADALRPPSA